MSDDDDTMQDNQSADTLSLDEFIFPDLNQTRQYLGERYQSDIENLKQCIDHITNTFVQGNQTASLVGAVANLFRVSIENNGQISHPDIDFGNLLNEEGDFDSNVRLYGPEAAFRAKPYFPRNYSTGHELRATRWAGQLGTERYPVTKRLCGPRQSFQKTRIARTACCCCPTRHALSSPTPSWHRLSTTTATIRRRTGTTNRSCMKAS